MRNLNELDKWRDKSPQVFELYGHFGDDKSGAFLIPFPMHGVKLRCVASNGEGWDHVSVSVVDNKRCPNWIEMDFVKRAFFHPEEVAMQLHPAERDHISFHPSTLHIWRSHLEPIPLPPKIFV